MQVTDDIMVDVLVAYEAHPKGVWVTVSRNGELVNVNLQPDDVWKLSKVADTVAELGDKLADIPQEDRVRITHAGIGVVADIL